MYFLLYYKINYFIEKIKVPTHKKFENTLLFIQIYYC
jgi:hypothetical protein